MYNVDYVEGRKELRAAGLLGSAMAEEGSSRAGRMHGGFSPPSSRMIPPLLEPGVPLFSADAGFLDADGDFIMGYTPSATVGGGPRAAAAASRARGSSIEVDAASGVVLGSSEGEDGIEWDRAGSEMRAGTGAGVGAGPSAGQRRERMREESEEEAQLRRRRRQAMVISEGGAPLSRDNIYGGVEGQ